jgi:DNA-binding IscR family transcriptional regulator
VRPARHTSELQTVAPALGRVVGAPARRNGDPELVGALLAGLDVRDLIDAVARDAPERGDDGVGAGWRVRVSRRSETSPMVVARAVPPGSVKSPGQLAFLRAVREHPDLAGARADARLNVWRVARVLAWGANWRTMTTRPTWADLMDRAGVSRATLARVLARLRAAGLLGVVATGRSAGYQTADRDAGIAEAAVYVLAVPGRHSPEGCLACTAIAGRMPGCAADDDDLIACRLTAAHRAALLDSASGIGGGGDGTETPTGETRCEGTQAHHARENSRADALRARSDAADAARPTPGLAWVGGARPAVGSGLGTDGQDEPGRAGTAVNLTRGGVQGVALGPRRAARADRLAVAAGLRERCAPLRVLRAPDLAAVVREFVAAGWSAWDVAHALDWRPDGLSHAGAPPPPGSSAPRVRGWVRWRLAAWRSSSGEPQRSPTQRRTAERSRAAAQARARTSERDAWLQQHAQAAATGSLAAAIASCRAALAAGLAALDAAGTREPISGLAPDLVWGGEVS